jgi:hypothetical protein
MSVGRILVWIAWIFATALVCANEEVLSAKSIPFDARFVSPDDSHAVDFVMIDREWHFRITDVRTGQADDSIVMPSLVLYLRWAHNSRSFVTVEHIAGGSYGRVVRLQDNKWTSLEVTPPGDSMMSFRVIDLQIKGDRVHFRFSVDYEKGNGIPFYYTFYDVNVELGTGKVFNTKWSPISQAEWLASLKREPSYTPRMTK